MGKYDMVEQVAVGEAANQGEPGLRMVYEVMRNRAHRRGTDFKTEALRRKQFTAAARPDLTRFYESQPEEVRGLASQLYKETQADDYVPRHVSPEGYRPPDHYMTKGLFYSDKQPSWVKQDKFIVVEEVGDHVLLAKPK